MKKWTGLLIFLLCLMLGASAAAEADPAVVSQFEAAQAQASDVHDRSTFQVFKPIEARYNPTPGLLEGMVADFEYRDNRLYVEVDTEKTDWATVIARGYMAGSGDVYIRPGFDTPEGYQGHMSFGCWLDEKETYIIEMLKRDYQDAGHLHMEDRADNGESIGRYDEETGIFQPIGMEDGNFVCVWYTADGKLEFRYLQTTLTFSDTDAFKVELPGVPADSIHLLYNNMTEADKALVDVQITTGSVMMEAADVSGMQDMSATLCVLIPEEAENSTVTCKGIAHDNTEYDIIVETPYPGMENAPARRYVTLAYANFTNDSSVREDEYKLAWYDGNGSLLGYQTLYFGFSTGDPKPWPCYVQGWKPVPAERLNGVKNNFLPGLDVVYDEEIGLLTYTVDPDELPLSADYGKVDYSVSVAPPRSTYTLRGHNQSGGNIVFGMDAAWRWEDQLRRTRDHAGEYRDEEIYGMGLFRTFHQQGKDLTVYMTSEMTGPYAGGVMVISWWEEGQNPETDDPALVEYFAIRQEKCVRVMESTPYEDEGSLPSVIHQPVIVLPQNTVNHPDEGLTFVAEIYPQKAQNCLYYRLKLVDENGDEVKLDKGQYKVFLPYPDGITEEQKASMTLTHMTDAHVEVENFSINGNTLHLTDAGLWFQATSFSPFLLQWEGESASVSCPHERLWYESSFLGYGFAEICDDCGHEAYAELTMPQEIPFTGRPVSFELNYEGEEWVNTDILHFFFTEITEDGEYGVWTEEAPSEVGSYVARMVIDMMETEDVCFSIVEATEENTRVESFDFDDSFITAELDAAGLKTVSDVRLAFKAALLEAGKPTDSSALYEVQFQYLLDGVWVTADAEHFPMDAAGNPSLTVEMPVPEGSDPAIHQYHVAHMFATSAFGNIPGDIETPDVEVFRKPDGTYWLRFSVTGLSPVMVTWELKPTAPPPTGDSAMPAVWLALCIASLLCAATVIRKKHA